MPDKVYPKYALRATGENQLNLSDAEQIYLRDRLDNQLINSQISGIPQEIVLAIYRQTIRYNKREDDLCGSRLADLISTKSSAHYCNCHVRELVDQSILITREGYYGRILSINFQFEQWGKTAEENGRLISDPEGFCAEHMDKSIPPISSTKPSETPTEEVQSEAQEKPVPEFEHAEISSLKEAIQTLSNELATLKALLREALPNLLPANGDKNKPEIASDESEKTLQETEENTSTRSYAPRGNEETAQKNEDSNTSECKTAVPSATLERCEMERGNEKKIPQDQDASASELHSHATHENKNKNKCQNSDKKDDLSFPEELKPHEKNAICKALEAEKIEDKSTCQLLLDDLSSRFKISDWQPIRSPIAYFKSLIRSYKQGTFDTSYVEDFRTKRKAAEVAQQEQQSAEERREYLNKYNEAKNNYAQLKFSAHSLGLSLREMAKRLGWTAIIEEMGFDLDAPVPIFES